MRLRLRIFVIDLHARVRRDQNSIQSVITENNHTRSVKKVCNSKVAALSWTKSPNDLDRPHYHSQSWDLHDPCQGPLCLMTLGLRLELYSVVLN
jgi:hypothetical protein